MDGSDVVMVVVVVLIGLPWLVLHYMTKWKTAATLTNDDETLLEELYQLARKLDDRMDTIERLVLVDHPEYQQISAARQLPQRDAMLDDEIEDLRRSRRVKSHS